MAEYKCYICEKPLEKAETHVIEFKDKTKFYLCKKCKNGFMKMIGKPIKG